MRKSVLFVVLASFVAVYANDKAHNHTAAPAHTMQHHQEMLDTQTPLTPSQQMLNLMHEPMMKTPFLEDDNLDLNFISNMIPHHQGAVDSSEFLLKHSKNKQLRAIATQIIKTQQAEINEFEALIPQLKQQKKLYSPKEVTLFNQQAKQDMETMHKDMSNITLTKNINHDFLAGMIPHHQAAIKAAKQILVYTQNEQVKAIAQNIIKTQEHEVETFTALLSKIH